MDDFNGIAQGINSQRFEAFTRAVQANPEWQAHHAQIAPIVIWTVAGVDEANAFAISAN